MRICRSLSAIVGFFKCLSPQPSQPARAAGKLLKDVSCFEPSAAFHRQVDAPFRSPSVLNVLDPPSRVDGNITGVIKKIPIQSDEPAPVGKDRIRSHSTPISEAYGSLTWLIEMWNGWFPDYDFLENVFKPLWDDPETSGGQQIDEIKKIENMPDWFGQEPITPEGRSAAIKIATAHAACAYCVQAMKARKGSSEAWSYAIDGARWLGILQGFHSTGSIESPASQFARRGADAAHAENRAMKSLVMTWCDDNMANFKSMDAAAEAIAGKLVPVTFRTARSWIGTWKKLRSAGTP
ncbi:hypothetical protein [Variovorax boronicumulans]|uniref:hypothetical protein n=1 Tax=Variovorax boronicumulans TaxID=436515 RepID=UPI002784C61A|nr:hypothetical protein [Variovorax boronicumulans]MDQ0040859.1 hypothetical protein [Variovorax boronicumulans]